MQSNLLEETLRDLGVKTIDEAIPLIEWSNLFMEFKEIKNRSLSPNHTDAECAAFLSAMAAEYDVYEQEVSGTIMLKDGTWITRIIYWDDDDYDAYWKWSERRTAEHHEVPQFKPLN